jgi:uncharacterized protein (TIGR03083 family)
MVGFGEAYADTRRRIVDLVNDLDEDEAQLVVPACPAWTVRDVLAHISAVAVDASHGNLEGVGSEEWTQRQLDERKHKSIAELLMEWDEVADQIAGALDYFPKGAASLFVGDTVTHEHDIRLPLRRPGDPNAPAVEVAVNGYVRWFGRRLKDREMPAVKIEAEGREWVAGAGEPGIEVTARTMFELLRGLTGRRTRDEIAAYRWSGDPAPYLDVFSMYGMPAAPLGE